MPQENNNFTERLLRLEAVVENMSTVLTKLAAQIENKGKINWAPIAIGVTIFFTVAGSVATVYNSKLDVAMEAIIKNDQRLTGIERIAAERGVTLITHEERLSKLEQEQQRLQRERDELYMDYLKQHRHLAGPEGL